MNVLLHFVFLSINDLICVISICNAHCSSYGSVHVDGQFLGCEFCMPTGMVLYSIIRNCYCGGRATIHVPWLVFGIWFIGLEISHMHLGILFSVVWIIFFFVLQIAIISCSLSSFLHRAHDSSSQFPSFLNIVRSVIVICRTVL
jgi:hypothetical protein